MNKIKEADILDKAKLTLDGVFKGELTLLDKSWSSNHEKGFDGHLLFNGVELLFTILPQDKAGAILKAITKNKSFSNLGLPKHMIFILDYASPEVISLFKENNLFFVDTAGNCYINLPNLKVYIEGRQKAFNKLPDSKIAFQKTGLKLIYQLLIEPELARENYRTIASRTGISLASLSNIFEELQEDNFIVTHQRRMRRGSLSNVELLITKWAVSYAEVLRPKIHRGYFRSLSRNLGSRIISDNSSNEIYFGGQLGARYLSNGIIAQKPILFSNIRLSKMVEKYKIIPISPAQQQYEKIEVLEVLEVFWNVERLYGNESNQIIKNMVDPILIYADLMMSSDFRSREAAKNILKNDIRSKFLRYKFQW